MITARDLQIAEPFAVPVDTSRLMGYNCRADRRKRTMKTVEIPAEVLLERIEIIAHELEELRRTVLLQTRPAGRDLAHQLYGALGQGSWDEYDLDLDWQRFYS
jgi:hypothetical protein